MKPRPTRARHVTFCNACEQEVGVVQQTFNFRTSIGKPIPRIAQHKDPVTGLRCPESWMSVDERKVLERKVPA